MLYSKYIFPGRQGPLKYTSSALSFLTFRAPFEPQ